MATAETGKKICMVCGKDVAGQPRVKDERGRYMCAGECQAKAAAEAKAKASAPAKSAPAAPPMAAASGDGGSLMNNLLEDSPMLRAANCESCGNPMPGGAVLCTRCGFNTQTGKALKTAVIVEKVKNEPKAEGGKKVRGGWATNGWVIFGVAGLIGVAAGLTPMIDLDLALPGFIVLVVLGLAAFITACAAVHEEGSDFMIGVFLVLRIGTRYLTRMGGGGSAIAAVAELLLVLYILIFVENPMAKALTGAAFLGWLCFGFCIGMQGKTMESVLGL